MAKKAGRSIILCVEDEADIRSFACKVLTLEGYYCLQAETEEEVFRLLNEEDINLVLLDLKLSKFDGWEILEEIKRNPKTWAIPVIICTASFGQPQEERAIRLGASGYLIKPVSANVLRNAVSSVLIR
jgi:DNA-binding response OmpR family regulator